jgi:hypothetical protein
MLTACASPQRMGMVVDPATGLQHGSVVEKNIVVDASQFSNRKIKVKIRNTSGDPAFDLHGFRSSLESAYRSKGYDPSQSDDFGILLDVNVLYSGQVRQSLTKEFAFLGVAAGGIVGARSSARAGTAIGIVSGAALGSIIGSYVTNDTYIVVADVSIGVADVRRGKREKTILFGARDKKKEERDSGFKPFREMLDTGIAAYSGGRSISQSRIANDVRQRFLRILMDVI